MLYLKFPLWYFCYGWMIFSAIFVTPSVVEGRPVVLISEHQLVGRWWISLRNVKQILLYLKFPMWYFCYGWMIFSTIFVTPRVVEETPCSADFGTPTRGEVGNFLKEC